MKIHKLKFEKAKEMLLEGKSQREIAKALRLGLNQVNEVAKTLNIYVDLNDVKSQLESVKKEFMDLSMEVKRLRREALELEEIKNKQMETIRRLTEKIVEKEIEKFKLLDEVEEAVEMLQAFKRSCEKCPVYLEIMYWVKVFRSLSQ